MIDILITGVGGQGTVLAAKLLAQAAQAKGWDVRTAETMGMAQRGGSVVSHVRLGNLGEKVYAPLLAKHSANLIIAFEPAEAARTLEYLRPGGTLVCARTTIQPVTAALSREPYRSEDFMAYIASRVKTFVPVDDEALCSAIGTRRALNILLLATALNSCDVGIGIDELKEAIKVTVKPKFVDMNLHAVDVAIAH